VLRRDENMKGMKLRLLLMGGRRIKGQQRGRARMENKPIPSRVSV
jgi:hypothetical protein